MEWQMRGGLTQTQFPFLAQLADASRRELGAIAATRVKPDQHLLRRGDAADGAYLVVSGSLRVYYITAQGREATLYHVEPGGTCILALTATFNEEPYPAWVEAGAEGAVFVRVPSDVFRRLFDGEPVFRDFLFSVLSGRVFELMRALEETGSTQIEQRVARYLVRRIDAKGTVHASQVGIASELGTAREVVFRALRSLATRGLLETGRARIKILDLPQLRRVAES
jgi:CRP/FNR family transcriptional regulator, anaerobic regulatory protein